MSTEIVMFILEGAVSLYFLVQILKLAKGSGHSMMLVFLFFGMIGLLVNNSYWIAYDFIHPDIRMPFAVNEFGEAAGFLLFSSAIRQAVPGNGLFYKKEIAGTVLFTAASIALWIGWSGEWLQDILGGIVYGYCLLTVVRAAKQTEAFKKEEWILIAAGSTLVIAGHAATFLLPDQPKQIMNILCYCLMFAGIVYFIAKSISALQKKEIPVKCLALSFAAYAWTTSTIYMSEGIWYSLASAALCATLLLILASVKREVAAS